MKTVTTQAAAKAQIRDSFNKNLCPVVKLDKSAISALIQAQEIYPLENKDKKIQAIIYDDQGTLVGILNYMVACASRDYRKSMLSSPIEPNDNKDANAESKFESEDDSESSSKGDDE